MNFGKNIVFNDFNCSIFVIISFVIHVITYNSQLNNEKMSLIRRMLLLGAITLLLIHSWRPMHLLTTPDTRNPITV